MKLKHLAGLLLGLTLAAGAWGSTVAAPAEALGASQAGEPSLVIAPAAGLLSVPPAAQPAPTATVLAGAPVLAVTANANADQSHAADDSLAAAGSLTAAGSTHAAGSTDAAGSAAVPAHVAARVPILEYHYNSFEMLPSVMMKPEWFQAQMRWLAAAGFHTLSSAELAAFVDGSQPAPARSVALTFDVGASHFDEYANDIVPTLRRQRLRAIFFVMPSQTQDTCTGQLACWPSLLAWRDEGLISIESHSYMHEDYATLSPEMLAFDILRSKRAIEAHTGQPVLGLCYPFDSLAPAALDLLARAGYRYAVAGATRPDRSAHWRDPQPFALPRAYPYSGENTYPLIGGTHGLTFEQMILEATE